MTSQFVPGPHPSHDWHSFEEGEPPENLVCHRCEVCTCHSPVASAEPCDPQEKVEQVAIDVMKQWGVQLDEDGSMDFYDSEEAARSSARGCPVWSVTYELLPSAEQNGGHGRGA